MAQLFETVFKPQSIYEMFFFNVKSVLTHPSLFELKKENPVLFQRWEFLSKSKFNFEVVEPITIKNFVIDPDDKDNVYQLTQQEIYEVNAPNYIEFGKIVAITYATLYIKDGTLKRYLKTIVNEDEFITLLTFMDELWQLSSNGVKSTPMHFPILCGHNIIKRDIPLLIRKFIFYRDKFEENKQIPFILKNSLNSKPWESNIVDTVNVWKFNGYDNIPLMLISDYLGLKKTVDLLPLHEVSRKYWELYENDVEKALQFVSLQSATQTNLTIQLMNELRQL